MAESSEVQALEKISTEVGESQIKITLSSQCIKAQAFLVDKLKKQIERQREICNFINSNNFKLQTEIKQAELEIKSLIIAHETIKSGNVELKKEFLLAKERKSEISERISNGEKKYEALWLESKERYESIPFVRKLLQANAKTQTIKDNIVALENRSQSLLKDFKTKKDFFANLNRNRIIELADYLVNVLPNAVKSIQEKTEAINSLSKEMDDLERDKEATVITTRYDTIPVEQKETLHDKEKPLKLSEDGWLNVSSNKERDLITMPRLQFINSDFDALNAKLDQIKIMKVEILNTTTAKRLKTTENISDFSSKKMKDDEFSIFFNHRTSIDNNSDEKKGEDTFSRKKLINILDDVKLDEHDAYTIVSKVNFENLKGVDKIGENELKANKENRGISDKKENEDVEEIDLTKSRTDKSNTSLLIPPTQFLDLSQDKLFSNSQQQVEVIVHMSMNESSTSKMSQMLKNSQEVGNKKKVSFDLPLSIQEIENTTKSEEEFEQKNNDNSIANETIESQNDISLVSDESYSKIKDMILKKHNLDLSPQFTYAKNRMMQKNAGDEVITSKFFQADQKVITMDTDENKTDNTKEKDDQENGKTGATEDSNKDVMDIDDVIVSSPKAASQMKIERPVSGLLFNHGTQGIPDSLNVSISTTGFEEGDTDFPHCIDSSLLLSPKADLPMPMSGDNMDVTSQEVPNFLSGLRKTGLSFFGQSTATESKPDTSGQNDGNSFNFNFGGGEQKSRGGLFNMFR